MYPTSQYPFIVFFNAVHISSAEIESCDAKMEVYKVIVNSDTGCREEYTYFEGTSYNPDYQDLNEITLAVHSLSTTNLRGFYQ